MSIWGINPWSTADKGVTATRETSMSSAAGSSQPNSSDFKVNVLGVEWSVLRTANTWEFQVKGGQNDGYAGSMRGNLTKSEIARAIDGPRSPDTVPASIPNQVLVAIYNKMNEQNR